MTGVGSATRGHALALVGTALAWLRKESQRRGEAQLSQARAEHGGASRRPCRAAPRQGSVQPCIGIAQHRAGVASRSIAAARRSIAGALRHAARHRHRIDRQGFGKDPHRQAWHGHSTAQLCCGRDVHSTGMALTGTAGALLCAAIRRRETTTTGKRDNTWSSAT